MEKEKNHKIHYITSTNISSNISNSFDMRKDLVDKKNKHSIIDNKKLFNRKNLKKRDGIKTSHTNINSRNLSVLNESKEEHYKTNTNMKKRNYNLVFYYNDNLTHLAKVSNSVDKKKPNNLIWQGFTPKRHISENISISFKKTAVGQPKFLTLSDFGKRRNNSSMKILYEKKVKNESIIQNLFKKIKIQPKMTNTKISFRNKIIEKNNKIKIDKIKRIGKKMKYDLNTINDIESKQERIRNLLFGVSYMKEKKECELCHKIVDKHTYQFHYYSHPSPILNWIFLGTFLNANNLEEIKLLKIKYILNCAIEIKPRNLPNNIKYCHINLSDSDLSDITKHFEKAFSFIETARKNNQKILIHCKLGISRSPAILIGYLIKYMGYNTKSALNFLQSKRSQVHPNSSFISQLYLYERKNIRNNVNGFISPIITNSTADFSK